VWAPGNGPIRIPIPGGFLIGGVLLVNLIAAFIYRFELSTRKAGLLISHLGIIVLLLGELGTALMQRDSGMWLTEGETKSYAESMRVLELAIIDRTDPATDKVLAISERALEPGAVFQQPQMPFRVEVRGFFANSDVMRAGPQGGMPGTPVATAGDHTDLTARELPRTGKQDEVDQSVAWVELIGTEGSLGTFMAGRFGQPQEFTCAGRKFTIEMRSRRYYEPFSITLLDFKHDVYPGTQIARNFSSEVRLRDPERGEDRPALIYMNHPLRHRGLTFYQASYRGEDTTMLQVVRNPSRLLPYIACALVFLGLSYQFIFHLLLFINRRKGAL